MVLRMKDSGLRIHKKEWAKKFGMMARNMKECIKRGKKMEKENLNGLMEVII